MYKLVTFLGALVLSSFTHAIHIEALNGDLSNDPLAPTALNFVDGSNTVAGSVNSLDGVGGAGSDTRDFFTFTIDPGFQLTEINLFGFTAGNTGFALIDDVAASAIPNGGTAGSFLGGSHVDDTLLGGGLLGANIANDVAGAGVGFTFPLDAGDYTFLIQETGRTTSDYHLSFEVSAVPLPAAAWLFVSGLMGLFGLKRFRTQTS